MAKKFQFIAIAADSPEDIHRILRSKHRRLLQDLFQKDACEIYWMSTELLETLRAETPPEQRFGVMELWMSNIDHLMTIYEEA